VTRILKDRENEETEVWMSFYKNKKSLVTGKRSANISSNINHRCCQPQTQYCPSSSFKTGFLYDILKGVLVQASC
jgi:hypothetical protein